MTNKTTTTQTTTTLQLMAKNDERFAALVDAVGEEGPGPDATCSMVALHALIATIFAAEDGMSARGIAKLLDACDVLAGLALICDECGEQLCRAGHVWTCTECSAPEQR